MTAFALRFRTDSEAEALRELMCATHHRTLSKAAWQAIRAFPALRAELERTRRMLARLVDRYASSSVARADAVAALNDAAKFPGDDQTRGRAVNSAPSG